MDVGEILRLLRRRWAVVVPALVLTVVATVGAYVAIPTKYQSQVQLTMLNAPKITDEAGNYGNPYLAFDTTLSVDVDLLTRNLTSDASAQQLKALGVTESFTAAFANNALGPFMQLTVSGSDKAHIGQSIGVLINFTQQRWQAIQHATGAPTDSIVGMSLIAPPSAPAPVLKQKIEVVSGVVIIGIVLSLLLAVMVDASIRRRRARRPADDSHWPDRASQAAPMR
jgi:uncharacterized protein involved in exopolysaccharide biosynthesis